MLSHFYLDVQAIEKISFYQTNPTSLFRGKAAYLQKSSYIYQKRSGNLVDYFFKIKLILLGSLFISLLNGPTFVWNVKL